MAEFRGELTMHEKRLAAAGFAALAVALAGPAAESKERSPQELWDATCHVCHDTGVGPQILGQHLSAEKIKTIVRNGGLEMTPFSPAVISDAELDALAKWVSERDAPASPASDGGK
jgi:mono/diheme cytochrome c family protein